jgi:hypothetical protein
MDNFDKAQLLLVWSWYSMYSALHNSQPHQESKRISALIGVTIPQVIAYYLSHKMNKKFPQMLSLSFLILLNCSTFLRPGFVIASYNDYPKWTWMQLVTTSASQWLHGWDTLLLAPFKFPNLGV